MYAIISKDSVVEFRTPEWISDPLTDLLREGDKRLIQQAAEAESTGLLAQYAERRDAQGRRAVVRKDHLPEREILTGVGPVPVKMPKVRIRATEPLHLPTM